MEPPPYITHDSLENERIALSITLRDLAPVLANSRATDDVSGWVKYDAICTTTKTIGNVTLEQTWRINTKGMGDGDDYIYLGTRLRYEL